MSQKQVNLGKPGRGVDLGFRRKTSIGQRAQESKSQVLDGRPGSVSDELCDLEKIFP